jgi:hypothetical protein
VEHPLERTSENPRRSYLTTSSKAKEKQFDSLITIANYMFALAEHEEMGAYNCLVLIKQMEPDTNMMEIRTDG